MKKILFLINSLGGGGAERVLVNLVNHMDLSKYDVTVGTMYQDGNYRDLLRPEIKYFCKHSPCPPGISRIYRLIPARLLYQYFIGNRKFDVLIAYMQGAPVKVISGCPDKKKKKIAWLHNSDPVKSLSFGFWLTRKSAFRAYDSYNAIAGVSERVTKTFETYTGIQGKFYTIYNTNDVEKILQLSKQEVPPRVGDAIEICAAGRLDPLKGFDRLIVVAKRLHEEGYSFHVSIMGAGEGSHKDLLVKLISDNHAEEYVKLLGFISNPYAIMATSDLFVLSSRSEGLATVLTEAMIVGTPIVATDVSGTKEVLGENGEYGLVVPSSEDGIYEGIKRFLDDPQLLKHYREKSKERAEFFRPEKTVAQAEALIDMVTEQE